MVIVIFHHIDHLIDAKEIFHQLQPMNKSSGNDDVMIKVEVRDSYGFYNTPITPGMIINS